MSKRILLVAGGTGGHVFPAFAVAEVLRGQDHDVYWATDRRAVKYQTHWQGHKPIVTRSAAPANKLTFMIETCIGMTQSLVHLIRVRPHIVVGFGGYPSAPMLFTAQALGIPTLIHEANATIGLANRVLGRGAKKIAVSFESSLPKTVLTGNPVRPDIAAIADVPYEVGDTLNLLVFGGSLGAKIFETLIPDVLKTLPEETRKTIYLTQQVVGEGPREQLQKQYEDMGIEATLLHFIDDMPAELQTAHLVISRSGASTLAELTAAGRPAVFIPLTLHTDRQQYANAAAAMQAGGAVLLDELDGIERVTEALRGFLAQRQDLPAMAAAMKSLGRPRAAWTLADLIVTTAR